MRILNRNINKKSKTLKIILKGQKGPTLVNHFFDILICCYNKYKYLLFCFIRKVTPEIMLFHMFPPFKGERGKYKDGKRQVETRDGRSPIWYSQPKAMNSYIQIQLYSRSLFVKKMNGGALTAAGNKMHWPRTCCWSR